MPKKDMFKRVVLTISAIICLGGGFSQSIHKHIYALERNITGFITLNQVRHFSILKSKNCTLLYSVEDAEFAPLVARTAELYLPSLLNDFNLTDSKNPVIVIHPDAGQMSRLASGDDAPPIGIYYGGVINILSPRLWAGENHSERIDNFLTEGPIVHELTHFLLDIKTNGNFDIWFTEGIALYYEYKYTGVKWREDLAGLGTDISVEVLRKDFESIDKGLAYRRAFECIVDIVEENGENALRQIITLLAQGKDYDAAYAKACNLQGSRPFVSPATSTR